MFLISKIIRTIFISLACFAFYQAWLLPWDYASMPAFCGLILLLLGVVKYPDILNEAKNYEKELQENSKKDEFKVIYFTGLGISLLSAAQLLSGMFFDVGISKAFVGSLILGIAFLVWHRHLKKNSK